jgi:MscS family membrane protein
LGIGGIAIALAAQKTVENVFGGLSVITDHPVYVGDFCKFGDSVGTVEDIGLRSTRIRTLDRTVLTVPNAQFSSVTLENFSRQDKMLFHPKLNLRRDTTPEQVRNILAAIEKLLKAHPKVETGNLPVRFIGVGAYSLDIEIFVYILTEDGDEFMAVRQDLLLGILDAIKAAGSALAIPTQASIVYPTRNNDAASQASEPRSLPSAERS